MLALNTNRSIVLLFHTFDIPVKLKSIFSIGKIITILVWFCFAYGV